MFDFLKNHPFAVEAFFESSLVLTFALPKEQLQPFIPECLQLDTYNDRWAFIAVALVQTKGLRPKRFPAFMGNDFFLIGYRIFVRYTTNAGKRLRGLFILKSETNKKKMQWLGNIFTHYNYSTTDIRRIAIDESIQIESERSGLHIRIDASGKEALLPAGSPFTNWKEARRFAGPMPFTFTYNSSNKQVLIIEGVRENWTPQPVSVLQQSVAFLDDPQFAGARLANAFRVVQIPYYWKKGRIEQWKG